MYFENQTSFHCLNFCVPACLLAYGLLKIFLAVITDSGLFLDRGGRRGGGSDRDRGSGSKPPSISKSSIKSYTIVIFRSYLNMQGKLPTQRELFLTLTCRLKMSECPCPARQNDSEFEIFSSPNYSKYAVECD